MNLLTFCQFKKIIDSSNAAIRNNRNYIVVIAQNFALGHSALAFFFGDRENYDHCGTFVLVLCFLISRFFLKTVDFYTDFSNTTPKLRQLVVHIKIRQHLLKITQIFFVAETNLQKV